MTTQAAFASEPVRAALLSPDRGPLAFFCEPLAAQLPKDTMYASAFVLCAHMLLATRPGRLAGYPEMMYAIVEMGLENLALDCLPTEHAQEAVDMIVEVRRQDSLKA